MKLFATFSSLYLAALLMLFGNGMLTTYLTLDLVARDIDELVISIMTTAYYAGLVIGAKSAHKLIGQVGYIRSYVAASGITAAIILLIALVDSVYFWVIARFIIGLMMMCQYMVIESWLNEEAESNQRGRVFSFYMASTYLGIMLGQLVFLTYDTIDMRLLMIGAIAFSLSLVPLAVTSSLTPTPMKSAPLQLSYFFKRIPQLLSMVFLIGMLSGSFYGLGPLFATSIHLDTHGVGLYMAACVGGAFLLQWPLGYFSDHLNRLTLITTLATVIMVTTLVVNLSLWQLIFPFRLMLLVSVISVALIFTLYPLVVAIANDNIHPDKRVSLSGVLLTLYGIGAGIGPLVASYFIRIFNGSGLYLFYALNALLVVGFAFLKAGRRLRVAPDETLSHVLIPDGHISPIAVATLDPRIDEETALKQMEDEEGKQLQEERILGEIEAADVELYKRRVERFPLIPLNKVVTYQDFIAENLKKESHSKNENSPSYSGSPTP